MAKTYLDIQNSAYTVGNIMDWTNALTRLSGVPVDITEVYDSYDKAVEYAATNPVAYEGQLITVTENGDTTVYVITPAVQGTHVVGEGEAAVTYDVNIKKVGTVPSGDNASITITESGLVSLFGFATAENGMLPVREDGKLTWKTLEAIGAGDGNDNTTYEFALNETKTGIIVTPLFNGQPIMEGEEGAQTQKKFELALDVYTKAEADEKFVAKADYTPYDDTALTNKVSALEATINGTDEADGLVDAVAANTQAISDEVSAREEAIENITKAETGAIAVAVAAEAEARDEAIKVVDDKIGEVAEDSTVVDMIAAVEAKIPTVPTDVSAFNNDAGYLVAADIDNKADKADTLAGYGIGDAYTKTEVDNAIDAAKKSILGEGVEEAYDTLKELQDILQGTDGEAIDGLIESVDANKTAIATLNGDASTEGSVDKKIADAISPLATTEALEEVKATAEAAQTAEEVAAAIETAFADADLDKYAVAADVEEALADKANTADVVANTTFEEFKTANDTAISEARTGAVADVEAKGYAIADDIANVYATKDELAQQATDIDATIEATLKDYATIESVNTELAKKVDSGTITHSSDTAAEGVTVSGTCINIVVDAYTKQEVRDYVADAIETMTGGESAADVLLALNNHIDTYTEKVGQIDTKNSEQDTAIAAAQSQADKAVADAKTANDAIAELTNGQVATNKNDLDAVKGRLNTLETAKGDHETRIATAEGEITSLKTTTSNNSGAIGTLQGDVSALQAEDSRLAGLIDALEANKADASSVYTKTEVDTAVQEAIDAVEAIDLTPYATTEEVDAVVATINAELVTKANADDVYTIAAADAKFMTQDQVDARVNTLIDAANSEDTITNVTNLVEFVNNNAGDIAHEQSLLLLHLQTYQ